MARHLPPPPEPLIAMESAEGHEVPTSKGSSPHAPAAPAAWAPRREANDDAASAPGASNAHGSTFAVAFAFKATLAHFAMPFSPSAKSWLVPKVGPGNEYFETVTNHCVGCHGNGVCNVIVRKTSS